MSRIGKQPIEISQGVDVTLSGQKVDVKGPKLKLDIEVHSDITVTLEEVVLLVTRS